MKRDSLPKIIFLYVILVVASSILMMFVANSLNYRAAFKNTSDLLYKQAVNLSNRHRADFFSEDKTAQQKTIEVLNSVAYSEDIRIFLVATDGTIVYLPVPVVIPMAMSVPVPIASAILPTVRQSIKSVTSTPCLWQKSMSGQVISTEYLMRIT